MASLHGSSREGASDRTPSPEIDQDVLEYIRNTQQQQHRTLSATDLERAEKLKLDRFTHGASKTKSRLQREKEELDRKKKQQEQDAAEAYAEFVAAMRVDDRGPHRSKGTGFVGSSGKTYVGSRQIAPAETTCDAFAEHDDDDEEKSGRKDPAVKRKRATMDSFLTELQTQQAEREQRLSAKASSSGTSISTLLAQEAAASTSAGSSTKRSRRTTPPPSRHDSDRATTNICVLNMPFGITEASMAEFFAAYGDVATVKIMWPRATGTPAAAGAAAAFESRAGGGGGAGLTGFVAFMARRDAELAFGQCDGAMWGSNRIRLSWGKSMVLPARALYPKTTDTPQQQQHAVSDERVLLRSNANVVIRHRRHLPSPTHTLLAQMQHEGKDVGAVKNFLETVAQRVRTHGDTFETHLREKEVDNAEFAFLREPESAAYQYFRVCVDPTHDPVLPADTFTDETEAQSDYYSTDSGEESERTRGRRGETLGPRARTRFHTMLQHLTLRRERIGRVMTFALDNAAAHTHVVDILVRALLQPSTPIPRKLARLYCLSDILHNSGTPLPNAWKYRTAIESHLPLVFAHFAHVIHAFPGRMKQESIKAGLQNLLHVWESWLVLSPHVMSQLRHILTNPKQVLPPAAHIPPTNDDDEDLDGEAM